MVAPVHKSTCFYQVPKIVDREGKNMQEAHQKNTLEKLLSILHLLLGGVETDNAPCV